jgi:23S rRNA (cytosine1962-C5)-methyltransferase
METIILKPGRERSLINRHPWVFSGAVKKLPMAENGDIVRVVASDGSQLGYGFFSPGSQITCRMFSFSTQQELIDDAYWHEKLRTAFILRGRIPCENTDMYRLIHAEGDFFPGIIIDVYAGVAVVQILIKATEKLSAVIYDALEKLGFRDVYIKTKSSSQRIENVTLPAGWVRGGVPMPIACKENGIRFLVDIETGQKTGFFIDQRDNRAWVGSWSKGKKVLNTFSYSGGFSLYALAAGASLVHSVDSSKEAIALCEQNVAANHFTSAHQSFVMDCFDFIAQAESDYDIMVLDPPAFAKAAKAVHNATWGYKNLNLAALKKIKPGGLIFTFSCSQHIDRDLFRKIIFGAAADAKRNVRILAQLSQPADHPVNIYHPEGEYLKGLLLHVE